MSSGNNNDNHNNNPSSSNLRRSGHAAAASVPAGHAPRQGGRWPGHKHRQPYAPARNQHHQRQQQQQERQRGRGRGRARAKGSSRQTWNNYHRRQQHQQQQHRPLWYRGRYGQKVPYQDPSAALRRVWTPVCTAHVGNTAGGKDSIGSSSQQQQHHPVAAGFDPFTLLSYNVLHADYVQPNYFPRTPRPILDDAQRKKKLLQEIRTLKPDLLALQEADHSWTARVRNALGLSTLWKKRTDTRTVHRDGLVTAFAPKKFRFAAATAITFSQFPSTHARDNIALLTLLEVHSNALPTGVYVGDPNIAPSVASKAGGQRRFLLLVNTHLLYNPKRGIVKLGQLRMLFARIKAWLLTLASTMNDNNNSITSRITEGVMYESQQQQQARTKFGGAHGMQRELKKMPTLRLQDRNCVSLVLAGDFNCTPESALIKFVMEKRLYVHGINRARMDGTYAYARVGRETPSEEGVLRATAGPVSESVRVEMEGPPSSAITKKQKVDDLEDGSSVAAVVDAAVAVRSQKRPCEGDACHKRAIDRPAPTLANGGVAVACGGAAIGAGAESDFGSDDETCAAVGMSDVRGGGSDMAHIVAMSDSDASETESVVGGAAAAAETLTADVDPNRPAAYPQKWFEDDSRGGLYHVEGSKVHIDPRDGSSEVFHDLQFRCAYPRRAHMGDLACPAAEIGGAACSLADVVSGCHNAVLQRFRPTTFHFRAKMQVDHIFFCVKPLPLSTWMCEGVDIAAVDSHSDGERRGGGANTAGLHHVLGDGDIHLYGDGDGQRRGSSACSLTVSCIYELPDEQVLSGMSRGCLPTGTYGSDHFMLGVQFAWMR